MWGFRTCMGYDTSENRAAPGTYLGELYLEIGEGEVLLAAVDVAVARCAGTGARVGIVTLIVRMRSKSA